MQHAHAPHARPPARRGARRLRVGYHTEPHGQYRRNPEGRWAATQTGDEVLTAAARLRTDGIRFVRVHALRSVRSRALQGAAGRQPRRRARRARLLRGEPRRGPRRRAPDGPRVPGRPGVPRRARGARPGDAARLALAARHRLDARRPARAGRPEPALLPRRPGTPGRRARAARAARRRRIRAGVLPRARGRADGAVDALLARHRHGLHDRRARRSRRRAAPDPRGARQVRARRHDGQPRVLARAVRDQPLAHARRSPPPIARSCSRRSSKDVAAEPRAARDVHGEAVHRARGLEPPRARLALARRRQRVRARRRRPQRARDRRSPAASSPTRRD